MLIASYSSKTLIIKCVEFIEDWNYTIIVYNHGVLELYNRSQLLWSLNVNKGTKTGSLLEISDIAVANAHIAILLSNKTLLVLDKDGNIKGSFKIEFLSFSDNAIIFSDYDPVSSRWLIGTKKTSLLYISPACIIDLIAPKSINAFPMLSIHSDLRYTTTFFLLIPYPGIFMLVKSQKRKLLALMFSNISLDVIDVG